MTESEKEQGQHGCKHYRRRCKFMAPCCQQEFWCRHCHNEDKHQNEPDPTKRHELDRKSVTEVVCALCSTRQPVASSCTSCGVSFGAYSCLICPFFDDDSTKGAFHCAECGICRVGGEENFFHCKTCGSCYNKELRNNHKCVERAMHQNCPVCFEFLFESTDPTTVLKCGHTIHTQCLKGLEEHVAAICPSCPLCKASLGDYSAYWAALDRQAQQNPCPPEYAGWSADLLCNDCLADSIVPFHVVGLKCSQCGSYNTRRMGVHPGADNNNNSTNVTGGGGRVGNNNIIQALEAALRRDGEEGGGGEGEDNEEELDLDAVMGRWFINPNDSHNNEEEEEEEG